MTSVFAQEILDARAGAIRALLARPLLDRRAGEDFVRVVRHAPWLQRWFDDKCGWVLVVDARHGFARLRKVPVRPQPSRGALTSRSTPRPFTRRRYALLCVAAAVLSGTTRPQISLHELVDRVISATATTEEIATFVSTRRDERVALVDAVSALIGSGVLAIVEERGDYAETEAANVLYDVDDRRLGHLIAAPQPPSLATSVSHMLHEDRYGPWVDPTVLTDVSAASEAADDTITERRQTPLERALSLASAGGPSVSDEQQRRRSRHRIMRRLLDDPVVYYSDLDKPERSYLVATIGVIGTWVREAGMVLERRAEGLAVIDPSQKATDVRFPEGNDVVKFGALLLLTALVPDEVPDGPVRYLRHSVQRVIADKLTANPTWARAYQDETGAHRLTDAAVELLVGLALARADATGVDLLPAAGRYLPEIGDVAHLPDLAPEASLS